MRISDWSSDVCSSDLGTALARWQAPTARGSDLNRTAPIEENNPYQQEHGQNGPIQIRFGKIILARKHQPEMPDGEYDYQVHAAVKLLAATTQSMYTSARRDHGQGRHGQKGNHPYKEKDKLD